MAGTTPNLALYLPGGGSTGTYVPDEVADIDPLNSNFVKIDTFAGTVGNLSEQNKQYTGPAASIGTITGQRLGDEYQENDGSKIRWRYDGTNWLNSEAGLWLIRPTAPVVVGGTVVVNPDGSVTATGSTALSLNSIFTDRFQRYRIVYDAVLPSDQSIVIRLRSAGADNSAANYSFGIMGSSGASSSVVNTAPTLSLLASARFYGDIDVHDVRGAQPTGLLLRNSTITLAGVAHTNQQAIVHTAALAFDGLTFSNPVAMTMNVKVYGYA